MKNNNTSGIPQDMLMRYVSGEASLGEIARVSLAMKTDPDLKTLVSILQGLQDDGSLDKDDSELPMASMAAVSEGNLCDILCERHILRDYYPEETAEDDLGLAQDNCWIKDSGTPLHNVGRLLEKHGWPVARMWNRTLKDIEKALSDHLKVITIVDGGQLWHGESDGYLHAVVCLACTQEGIRIWDPASDAQSTYPEDEFEKAWHYSNNYLVTASAEGMEYIPHPIDVSDVDLDPQLTELSEAIAENVHEIWAERRREEGWRWGPERDDKNLLHPDMVPYAELPETEKYYDRDTAMNTLRLVKKLGFTIGRRLTEYCPECGEYVSGTMRFCPHCGAKLKR